MVSGGAFSRRYFQALIVPVDTPASFAACLRTSISLSSFLTEVSLGFPGAVPPCAFWFSLAIGLSASANCSASMARDASVMFLRPNWLRMIQTFAVSRSVVFGLEDGRRPDDPHLVFDGEGEGVEGAGRLEVVERVELGDGAPLADGEQDLIRTLVLAILATGATLFLQAHDSRRPDDPLNRFLPIPRPRQRQRDDSIQVGEVVIVQNAVGNFGH